MRAAVATGGLHVEEVPLPEPGPGEVRVRVLACGICGTDLHFEKAGLWAPGCIPGHEMLGEVDALGDGADGVARGDRVAVEPLVACGACPACRSGRPAICPGSQVLGIHRPGGFADYTVAPAQRLFPVPADLPPEVGALVEPMAVCVRGVRRGALAPGERVLVLGAGTIGLLSVLAARELGAGEVWASARHPHQAELARALGAARVLREDEATPEALRNVSREAEIDLCVETVGGGADTLHGAAAALRPGGRISVLGVFFGDVAVDALSLFLKEATLAWSNCYAHPPEAPGSRRGADFETAAELVSRHRSELSPLVTHRRPLGEIDRAFAEAQDKRAGAVKVSVLP